MKNASPDSPAVNPKALIVSANDLSTELGDTALFRVGIERRICPDPLKAFGEAESLQPDLVLVDVKEEKAVQLLVSSLRESETTRNSAIVILSRELNPGEESTLERAGVNMVIPMPFNNELWGYRLEELLLVPPRRETRIPVKAGIWSQEISEKSGELQGTALNISSGGMLVQSGSLLMVGSKLDIKFRLPGQTEELDVVAQVVWSTRVSEGLFKSGVQFLVTRGDARTRISEYVSAVMPEKRGSLPAADGDREENEWERELRISEARKMAILDNSINPIITTDPQGVVLEFNMAAELLLGYKRSQVMGKKFMDRFVSASRRNRLYQEFRGLITDKKRLFETLQFETHVLHRNGEEFPVEVTLKTMMVKGHLLFTAFLKDLSELKAIHEERLRLESQLRQSQKLEAIGTLASGVAHEINNILSAIVGYSELTLLDLPKNSILHSNVSQIISATDRASDVVRQILTFARKEKTESQYVQIEEVVKEALALIRKTFPATVEIRQEIHAGTGIVYADPTQLHQVVINLCTNALQALQEEGGRLSVFLDPVFIDSKLLTGQTGLATGNYALLVVKDTGHGIDPSLVPRIFEPFFTTKSVGEGTGLGLSVAYGIVHDLGGAIFVESKPGKGTTFRVYLPRMEGKEETRTKDMDREKRISRRILFVDDDPVLVGLGEKTLKGLGHSVTALSSGEAALEVLGRIPGDFDLLITDQVMPKMTGLELVEKIRDFLPSLPVVICTGFSEFCDSEKAAVLEVDTILMKPLKQAEIAEAIDLVMESRSG